MMFPKLLQNRLGLSLNSTSRSLSRSRLRANKHNKNGRRGRRTSLEQLEHRQLLAVDTAVVFDGLSVEDNNAEPPGPTVAVGPSHIVQGAADSIAIYDKMTGNNLLSQPLADFFGPINAEQSWLADVAFDEQIGRFVVAAYESAANGEGSLVYAVSDSSDPTVDVDNDGRTFSEMHRVVLESDPEAYVNFVRLGWNADAYVVSANVVESDHVWGFVTHAMVVAIDKSDVEDQDSGTSTTFVTRRDKPLVASTVVAKMHGAQSGDPIWMTHVRGVDSEIRVVKMENVLSSTPVFTATLMEEVDPWVRFHPLATQPDGQPISNSDFGRFWNADWRGDRLVAAHTVGLPDETDTHARWYEFDTSSPVPTIVQQGTIDPAPGVHTYHPAIAIAPNGDLGMTYAQSSDSQYVSMYITGRTDSDPLGEMRAPQVARAGEDTLSPGPFGPPSWGGGMAVDPVDETFWGTHQYATSSSSSANWGTGMAKFSVDDAVTVFADSFENGPWNGN